MHKCVLKVQIKRFLDSITDNWTVIIGMVKQTINTTLSAKWSKAKDWKNLQKIQKIVNKKMNKKSNENL